MDSINEYLADNFLCIAIGILIGVLVLTGISWVKDNLLS